MKSNDSGKIILGLIDAQARTKYKVNAVVESYMKVIEEIINIPRLLECLDVVTKSGRIRQVMDEVVAQSKVEFNYQDDEEEPAEESEDGAT